MSSGSYPGDQVEARFQLDEERFRRLKRLAESKGLSVEEYVLSTIDKNLRKEESPRREALRVYGSELTGRQQETFWLLDRFHLMTRGQVGTVFSKRPYDEGANIAASRTLDALIAEDLVAQKKLEFKLRERKVPQVYSQTPLGVFVCEALKGKHRITTTRRPYPAKLVTPQRLPHHLDLVDVGVC